MTSASPDLPPYDPERVLRAPFPERVRLVCRTWAAQIAPNQPAVLALYWGKYFLVFIGGWALFNVFNADYPGFLSPVEWAFSAEAFKKAVVWAIFYELTGLGCGWGPMNARFSPMIGGYRHFLRTGTTKLPLFRGVPLIGGDTRNWLDVGLYAANQLLLLRVLVAPEVTPELLLPAFVLIPALGILDKTLFLAARAEHYYVALVCLTVAAGDDVWISACKVLWGFIWFWAATSKLNHHFPGVIMVMMNNGPFFPKVLKKQLFRSYPDDLRPSTFAKLMASFGSATEYLIPVLLLSSTNETLTALSLALMFSFHGFIALNNPSGMPIEWNILMVYGGIFLFGANFDVSVLPVFEKPGLVAFLAFMLVVLPTFGNFFPRYLSFLLSMRYYAGNWAYNVWLFRKDTNAVDKLKKIRKPGGTVREQFAELLPDEQSVDFAMASMVSSRFMHLQGRPLLEALPKAVDHIDNYEWHEGEVVGGMIVGWNFGDGHLNNINLLRAVQAQCGFEEGELRMISVESQPLFIPHWEWDIYDAATGHLEHGKTYVKPMLKETPWPTGQWAEALERGSGG